MATKRKSAKRPGRTRRLRETEAERQEREDIELAEEILRRGKEEAADLAAAFGKILKKLGFKGKPMGAKKLREQLLKRGFDPNSNEFSRGIIEMREE